MNHTGCARLSQKKELEIDTQRVHPAIAGLQLSLVLMSVLGAIASPAMSAERHSTSSPQPPNAPLPSVQTIPSGATDDGYLLGPGDRIRVEFLTAPEFSGEFSVLPNGTITLPQIGAVSVQDRTLKQVSTLMSARFRRYLTRPIAAVSLVAARPITVVLAGEVNRPGSYSLGAGVGSDGTVPNLTRILQQAEGVTQAADLRRVQIRRISPVSGQDELITVNLWQLLKTADRRQDLRLRDGDSIFIPATANLDLAEARQLSNANFATKTNRPLKIVVVGEVNRPGPYTIADGGSSSRSDSPAQSQVASVTQAIQVAGGITSSADIRNIQVRRLTRSGEEQKLKLDFWKLLAAGDALQDMPLQDGDTIEIPTATAMNDQETAKLALASFSPDRISVNIVGEVERPGAVTVPPSTPLNQALLSAGGFNRRAKRRSVTLVRLNPNGTVSKRDVSVDFAQALNEKNNPALRNGDTIIVGRSTFAGITDAVGTIAAPFTGVLNFFRLFGF